MVNIHSPFQCWEIILIDDPRRYPSVLNLTYKKPLRVAPRNGKCEKPHTIMLSYLLTHLILNVMSTKKQTTNEEGKVEVFCPYIIRKGKKIPPPKGKKVWHFWVTPKTAA